MALKVAIVGLPNVGKSTLFNALTQTAAAQAANYPFCTIEPNTGDVAVPEPRLPIPLARNRHAPAKETIDPGADHLRRHRRHRVPGASKGEGLGNQFLANIRDCDAVAFVARCFEDDDITHVEGRIDPISDLDIIETELMLADLESLEKRTAALEKRAKGGDKESAATPSVAWSSEASSLIAGIPPAAKVRLEDRTGEGTSACCSSLTSAVASRSVTSSEAPGR